MGSLSRGQKEVIKAAHINANTQRLDLFGLIYKHLLHLPLSWLFSFCTHMKTICDFFSSFLSELFIVTNEWRAYGKFIYVLYCVCDCDLILLRDDIDLGTWWTAQRKHVVTRHGCINYSLLTETGKLCKSVSGAKANLRPDKGGLIFRRFSVCSSPAVRLYSIPVTSVNLVSGVRAHPSIQARACVAHKNWNAFLWTSSCVSRVPLCLTVGPFHWVTVIHTNLSRVHYHKPYQAFIHGFLKS